MRKVRFVLRNRILLMWWHKGLFHSIFMHISCLGTCYWKLLIFSKRINLVNIQTIMCWRIRRFHIVVNSSTHIPLSALIRSFLMQHNTFCNVVSTVMLYWTVYIDLKAKLEELFDHCTHANIAHKVQIWLWAQLNILLLPYFN